MFWKEDGRVISSGYNKKFGVRFYAKTDLAYVDPDSGWRRYHSHPSCNECTYRKLTVLLQLHGNICKYLQVIKKSEVGYVDMIRKIKTYAPVIAL